MGPSAIFANSIPSRRAPGEAAIASRTAAKAVPRCPPRASSAMMACAAANSAGGNSRIALMTARPGPADANCSATLREAAANSSRVPSRARREVTAACSRLASDADAALVEAAAERQYSDSMPRPNATAKAGTAIAKALAYPARRSTRSRSWCPARSASSAKRRASARSASTRARSARRLASAASRALSQAFSSRSASSRQCSAARSVEPAAAWKRLAAASTSEARADAKTLGVAATASTAGLSTLPALIRDASRASCVSRSWLSNARRTCRTAAFHSARDASASGGAFSRRSAVMGGAVRCRSSPPRPPYHPATPQAPRVPRGRVAGVLRAPRRRGPAAASTGCRRSTFQPKPGAPAC